ncbi:unnamed protein product [Meganyctiphanes norvegica]|uniref:FYVE-type domain-containing protein n=1 Tax=Meganyctiphanes norvegica TaxID=48144 RepID=A0AAV2PQE6_MEGNR
MAGMSTVGKKLIRSKSGLRIVPLSDSDRSPFELREPEWVPDKESPTCMDCKEKFDFLKRRHHCRRCGRVCCSNCCDNKLALPRMCFLDPVRLCDSCAKATSKENDFYEKDLKSLITGAILCLENDIEYETVLAQCRLSPDHRHLIVAGGDNHTPLAIPMHRVASSQITSKQNESDIHTLTLQYCLAGEEEESLQVSVPNDAPVSANHFVSALQRAIFMMQEARAVIGTGE